MTRESFAKIGELIWKQKIMMMVVVTLAAFATCCGAMDLRTIDPHTVCLCVDTEELSEEISTAVDAGQADAAESPDEPAPSPEKAVEVAPENVDASLGTGVRLIKAHAATQP